MDRIDKLTTLFESDEQLYFCVGLIILVGAIVIIWDQIILLCF